MFVYIVCVCLCPQHELVQREKEEMEHGDIENILCEWTHVWGVVYGERIVRADMFVWLLQRLLHGISACVCMCACAHIWKLCSTGLSSRDSFDDMQLSFSYSVMEATIHLLSRFLEDTS